VNFGTASQEAVRCAGGQVEMGSLDIDGMDASGGGMQMTTGLAIADGCYGTFTGLTIESFTKIAASGVTMNTTAPPSNPITFSGATIRNNQTGVTLTSGRLVFSGAVSTVVATLGDAIYLGPTLPTPPGPTLEATGLVVNGAGDAGIDEFINWNDTGTGVPSVSLIGGELTGCGDGVLQDGGTLSIDGTSIHDNAFGLSMYSANSFNYPPSYPSATVSGASIVHNSDEGIYALTGTLTVSPSSNGVATVVDGNGAMNPYNGSGVLLYSDQGIPGPRVTWTGGVISNNGLGASPSSGVLVGGSGSFTDQGTAFVNNGLYGVVVEQDSSATLTGATLVGNAAGGIAVSALNTVTLGSSTITGNGGPGISVYYGYLWATGVTVAGNAGDGVLVATDRGGAELDSCAIHGNSAGIVVTDGGISLRTSTVTNNAQDGIDLGVTQSGLIGASISGSTISANGGRGLFAREVDPVTMKTQVSMTGDDVSTNGAEGIYLMPITLVFSGNAVHDNANDQLVFDGAAAFDISSTICTSPNAVYSYTCKSSRVVGVAVKNGAVVNAAGVSWASHPPKPSVDYSLDADPASAITVAGDCDAIPACPL
jgi:hypothetical protein